MITTGDIVVVIGSQSIPDKFLGQYGQVVNDYDGKVNVQLFKAVGSKGSLSHTAYTSDLIKVGEIVSHTREKG
jgi:hypothetical protein